MGNSMKTKRAILFVLVAMLVASLFALNAFADHDDVYNLVDGVVDFSDYNGTDSAHAYLYDKLGMYFTDLGAITHKDSNDPSKTNMIPYPSSKVSMKNVGTAEEPDYAMAISGMTFVDGTTSGSSPDQLKYAMNKDILDLFFSANGPQKYTMELDLTINSALPGTTHDTAKTPISYYRGVSVISIGQYNYFFKATNAGIGILEATEEKITVDGKEYTVYNASEGDPNKGWLYASNNDMQADIVATATNGVLVSEYTGDPKVVTSAINPAAMAEGGDAVQYTVGKPFTVKMEFTRKSGGGAKVNVYLDMHDGNGEILFLENKDVPTGNVHKATGIRLMDTTSSFEILFDNFSLDIDQACGNNHGGFGSVQKLVRANAGYYIQNYCELCGVAYGEKTVVHGEYISSVAGKRVNDNSVHKSTKQFDFSLSASDVSTTAAPYRISFDLKVNSINADKLGGGSGKALLGSNNASASYPNLLRIWPAYGENGVLLQDRYIIRTDGSTNNANRYVGVIKVGGSYSFDVIMDPSTGKYDVYMDGEYVQGETNGRAKFMFTGTENQSLGILRNLGEYGDFDLSNVTVTRPAVETVHDFGNIGARTILHNDDGLYIVDECICGEKSYSKTSIDLYDASLNTGSEAFKSLDKPVTMNSAKWIYTTEDVIGSAAAPYWIAFDLTVDSVNASIVQNYTTGSNLLNVSGSYNGLRANKVKASNSNEFAVDDSDVSTDRVAISSSTEADKQILFVLKQGDKHQVALYVMPATKQVAIYVDGKYVLTRGNFTASADSGKWYIRIMDTSWAQITFDNIVFAKDEAVEHVHTDAFSNDFALKTINNKITYSYKCFCGETVNYGINELVKDNLVNAYEGVTSFSDMPTTGEYWVAFDYNVRNAGAINANAVKLGDTVLLAVDKNFDKPTTVTYAIKVKYVGENTVDYTVYADGAAVDTQKGIAVTGNTLTLGDADAANVRFNYLKIVKMGVGGDKTVKHTENAIRPCRHNLSVVEVGYVENTLCVISECSVCGERTYATPDKNLYDASLNTASEAFKFNADNAATVTTVTWIHTSKSVMNADAGAKPFWISFNLKVNSLNINSMAARANDDGSNPGRLTTGHNLFNFYNNSSSPLRMFLLDTEGNIAGADVLTTSGDKQVVDVTKLHQTKVALRDNANLNSNNIAYLENGGSYEIALYCDPATGNVDIYINGEYACTRTKAMDADGEDNMGTDKVGNYKIRILDGTWGNFTFENFTFASVSSVIADHTCTDEWSDDINVITGNNTLVRSYTCYCGKENSKQITGIVIDNIESARGKGTQSYVAPDGEYWIVSDICTDENTTGALLTLGETELVNATELAETGKTSVAVCVNGYDYILYVNGTETKRGVWNGETVITYGNDGLINLGDEVTEGFVSTQFIYNKIVTIGVTDDPVVPKVNGCDHVLVDSNILCSYCGENIVRTYTNVVATLTNKFESAKTGTDENGMTKYGYRFCDLNSATIGEMFSMDAFWISFDFTPVEVPDLGTGGKSFVTWVTKVDGKDVYDDYFQFIRAFNAKDADGNVIPDAIELRLSDMSGNWPEFDIDLTMYKGQKYGVDIRVEPLETGCCNYYVYIDGVYCGTETRQLDFRVLMGKDMDPNKPYCVRFNDIYTGHYIYENAMILADHEHISYSDNARYYVAESGVEFSLVSTCAICGNEIAERYTSAVVSDISDISDGYEKISVTAPDGKYVITTDINIRERVSGALITLGDTLALSVPVNVAYPTTLSVAVVVDGNLFEVFIDGKFFQNGELSEALTEITFGNDNFGAYVRYNNNKVATLGVIYTPVTVKSAVDANVKVCYHTMAMGVANSIYYDANGVLNSVYVCSECGERVYAKIDQSIFTRIETSKDASKINTEPVFAKFNDFELSRTSAPYWISFDVTMLSYPVANPSEEGDKTAKRIYKGYSLLNVQDAHNFTYNSQLRMFSDGWEPGSAGANVGDTPQQGETDGKVDVHLIGAGNDYRAGKKVASLELDKAITFAVYVDPATGKYDVYVDGEYIASSRTDAFTRNNNPSIRFHENSGGSFKFENIQIARAKADCNDGITVIETQAEFTATATESGIYEALTSIKRTDAEGNSLVLDLLYVDTFTGQLAYKTNDEYVLLVNSAGLPIQLGDEASEINYVYDDIRGTVRFFINGTLPYIAVSDAAEGEPSIKMVEGVSVDSGFADAASINDKISALVRNSGSSNHHIVADVEIVNVYGIHNSGTAEILGYQENEITNSIRFVAGVDTAYFTEVGFDLKVYDVDGVTDITSEEKPEMLGNVIYSAVTANDKYLYAGRYGFNYFSVVTIDEVYADVGQIIEATPYTMIGNTKISGDTARVRITENGYEFVELGNGFTPLPNITAEKEPGLDKLVGLRRVSVNTVDVVEDTYVIKGEANTNFDKIEDENGNIVDNDTLHFKAYNGSNDSTYRIVLLKFDISNVDISRIASAKLSINCTAMEDISIPTAVNVYSCSDKIRHVTKFLFWEYETWGDVWNESNVTYNEKPKQEGLIASGVVYGTGTFRIDITDYLLNAKREGKTTISLWLEGDKNTTRHLRFSSKESGTNIPTIILSDGNADFSTDINYSGENPWDYAVEYVNEWFDRWELIKANGDTGVQTIEKIADEYATSVGATKSPNGANTRYENYDTRTVDSLVSYTSTTDSSALIDEYGGFMDESMRLPEEERGFFTTKKIGDRWWTFDPLGYPFYRVACVLISTGNSRQWAAQKEANGYTTYLEWAQGTTNRLKTLGFNSTGGWSKTEYLSAVQEPLAQTSILYVLSNYCSDKGLNISKSGSTELLHDILPVFDPEFVAFADSNVSKQVLAYANAPYIYGWMSDNELPQSLGMLDNALMLDVEDERFAYSYATAWTFMYLKTGKINPSLADVTNELRKEYRAMVYDRYYKVVSEALEKYAPNHQYVGCRLVNGGFQDEYVMRVSGYWCDVVSLNYYGVWEGDAGLLANMQKWAGKPFIITEWYAKGMDACTEESGLTNESGAGWTVATQNDRGLFYENYALQLLECKGCVGFDWFQYLDNDPTDANADWSNINSNKGIIDNNGKEYTALTDHMDILNNQKYSLINFFDERNAE